MKVYVDIDDTRKITTYHDGLGTQQGLYVYSKDKIEVLSLSDYTKQVRKEVCEEIRDLAGDYFDVHYCEVCGETAYNDIILKGDDLTEILDQI